MDERRGGGPDDDEGADDVPFDGDQTGMAEPGNDAGFAPGKTLAGNDLGDDDGAPDEDQDDPAWSSGGDAVAEGDGADPVERLRGLVTYLAVNLVDEPDEVAVTVEQRGTAVHVQVRVAPDDLGKVIGRQGRVARAMRTTLMIAGSRGNLRTSLAIEE